MNQPGTYLVFKFTKVWVANSAQHCLEQLREVWEERGVPAQGTASTIALWSILPRLSGTYDQKDRSVWNASDHERWPHTADPFVKQKQPAVG